MIDFSGRDLPTRGREASPELIWSLKEASFKMIVAYIGLFPSCMLSWGEGRVYVGIGV